MLLARRKECRENKDDKGEGEREGYRTGRGHEQTRPPDVCCGAAVCPVRGLKWKTKRKETNN